MIYGQLVRFLLPLVLTVMVQELSGQVLNGGMARVPDATQTLASYGLAWGIVSLMASPLNQVKQLGLVLVEDRPSYIQVGRYVAIMGVSLTAVLLAIALTPAGSWVVETLHGVTLELGTVVRAAILWLAPFPLIRGGTLFYSGLLLRSRRADMVSLATLANIAAGVTSVFGLLPSDLVRRTPILLPVLVIYSGAVAEFAVVLWSHRRLQTIKRGALGKQLSHGQITRFFWPLALITVFQGFSRPLINLFIAREAGGAESLAVLTVVYSLAHVLYGWLNEVRSLPTAFREAEGHLKQIFRFSWACGLFSFALMIGIFWSPLRDIVVGTYIGLSPELTALAQAPLIVFSFFPLAVMNRAYLHGVGLLEHRTSSMAPSAVARIAAILAMLVVAPIAGVSGATRGIAALLCGFIFETITLWWGVRGRALLVARSAPR